MQTEVIRPETLDMRLETLDMEPKVTMYVPALAAGG